MSIHHCFIFINFETMKDENMRFELGIDLKFYNPGHNQLGEEEYRTTPFHLVSKYLFG